MDVMLLFYLIYYKPYFLEFQVSVHICHSGTIVSLLLEGVTFRPVNFPRQWEISWTLTGNNPLPRTIDLPQVGV